MALPQQIESTQSIALLGPMQIVRELHDPGKQTLYVHTYI